MLKIVRFKFNEVFKHIIIEHEFQQWSCVCIRPNYDIAASGTRGCQLVASVGVRAYVWV